MKRFVTKIFVFLLAIAFWETGLFEPVASDFGGQGTIAWADKKSEKLSEKAKKRLEKQRERQKKRLEKQRKRQKKRREKCRKNPAKCQPPTVSELPIQYMVLSGTAVIALSGGTVFYIRKRKMKNSQGV